MSVRPQYETSFLRAVFALLFGAVIGAFIFIGPIFFIATTTPLTSADFNVMWLIFVIWLVGLTVFGILPWAILHLLGLRQWYVAVAIGAVLPMVFIVVIGDSIYETAKFAPLLVPVGMVTGWVVWRVAYRRVKIEYGG